MQRDNLPREIGSLFPIGFRIELLLAHGSHGYIVGDDLTLLVQEIVAAPNDLVATEERRAPRDAPLVGISYDSWRHSRGTVSRSKISAWSLSSWQRSSE